MSLTSVSPDRVSGPQKAVVAGTLQANRVEDQRSSDRQGRILQAMLVRSDGAKVGPCATDNLSEGGLHLTAPVGYGLAVGQRYEVMLIASETGSDRAEMVNEGHFATVVRTCIHTTKEVDHVSVGLRFDQPLFL